MAGGTRLKVYESMAAKVPIVSTTVGAEGLEANHPDNIRLADNPADFARNCLELLDDAQARMRIIGNAWDMVNTRFSNEIVARHFERILTGSSPGRCASAATEFS